MSRRNREDSNPPISLFAFQDVISTLSGIFIFIVLIMAVDLSTLKPAGTSGDVISEKVACEQIKGSVEDLKQRINILKKALSAYGARDAVNIAEKCTETERDSESLQSRQQHLIEKQSELQKKQAAVNLKRQIAEHAADANKQQISILRAALATAVHEKKLFFIPEPGITKTPLVIECSGNAIRAGYIDRDGLPVVFEPNTKGMASFEQYLQKLSTANEYLVFMIKPSGCFYLSRLLSIAAIAGFDVGYDALEETKSIGFGRATL